MKLVMKIPWNSFASASVNPVTEGPPGVIAIRLLSETALSAFVAPIPRDWDCRGKRATVPIPRGAPAEFVSAAATVRSCELPFGECLRDPINGDAVFTGLMHIPLDAVAQTLGR